MSKLFIGRRNELALLREELGSPRPSLAVIYGRRRVGKSTLLREAIKDEANVFYQASRVTSSLSLEAFKLEVSRTLGSDELLTGIADWLAVLHYLARAAERRPGLIIVLDEFPYLADADPALPSVIQKFWDSGAARLGNLKLLLCGSMISHMEELFAERNPLYGRKTLALDWPRYPFARRRNLFLAIGLRTSWRPAPYSVEYRSICSSSIVGQRSRATSSDCC